MSRCHRTMHLFHGRKLTAFVVSFLMIASSVPSGALGEASTEVSTAAATEQAVTTQEDDTAAVDESTTTTDDTAAVAEDEAVTTDTETTTDDSDAAVAQEDDSAEAQVQAQADETATESVSTEPAATTDDSELSTMESVEDAGKYSVVIDYVDSTTSEKIAASYQAVVDAGASWAAASPTIAGYKLTDATKVTVSGTATGDDHWITATVTYDPQQVTYQVVHMKQVDGGDGYYVAETDTYTGTAGKTVKVEPKTSDAIDAAFMLDYELKAGQDDHTLTIAADGGAVKTYYYDQNPMTWCIYFNTQGSYVPTITGHEGNAVTTPSDPTRTGYTFAGWDIDKDGVADTLPTTMPNNSTYAVALWTPATVNYVINYYKQNTDGTTYTLKDTTTATGTTGETTATAPLKDTSESGSYAYFEYDHEDPVTINADGTSVLNVYYDRVEVTVIVNLNVDGTIVEYARETGLYGTRDTTDYDPAAWLAKYQELAPTSTKHVDRCVGVKDNLGRTYLPRGSEETDWDTKTATYQVNFTNNDMYSYYCFHSYENLDGTYTDYEQNYTCRVGYTNYGIVSSTNGWKGFTISGCNVSTNLLTDAGYVNLTWSDTWTTAANYDLEDGTNGFWVSMYGPSYNAGRWTFTRNTYTDTYYSGGTATTATHKYEEEYSTSEVDGDSLTPPTAGYVFAGWYTTSDFSGDPVTSAKQDANPAVYYAKWVPASVTVTFDSNGGTPVASQTFPAGEKATRPEDPTKTGCTFGGWYYTGTSGAPARYDFDEPVSGDITLTALWNPSLKPTTYTVIHKTTDGTVIAEENGLAGTSGTTATATALASADRQGYIYVDAESRSLDLGDDADTNVIIFTYSKDPIYTYTVHYVDSTTGAKLADDYTFTSSSNLVSQTAKTISGYSVNDVNGYVSADETSYTFKYTKDATPSGTVSTTTDAFATKDVETATHPEATFTFTITAKDGAPEPTKTSGTVTYAEDEVGKMIVDLGEITFDEEGTYTYTITEETPGDGWTADKPSYDVTVTVTDSDGDGKLEATVTGNSVITNSYTADAKPEGGTDEGTVTPAVATTTTGTTDTTTQVAYKTSSTTQRLAQTGDATALGITASLAAIGLALVAISLKRRRDQD